MKHPKNETETHFMLKEISKYILFNMGYTRLATEVGSMYSCDLGNSSKNVIDAVGLKKTGKLIPNSGYRYDYRWSMCGMEAKASLSDFRNGFCMAPAIIYIIAPKGIIPLAELPERVGLIEVDFDKLSIKQKVNKINCFKGIEVVVKAKRKIDGRFSSKEDYNTWCKDMLEQVSYRATSELLFWRNVIPLVK